ncbi:MAG TPA: hypothetical protein VF139_06115 [Candidatus Polarisedimenticolaceae bacterium]
MRTTLGMLGVALATVAIVAGSAPALAQTRVDCEMTFNLKGWSAVYKTAKGSGTIRCDNGQSFAVRIKVTGGGITFGKTEISNGKGKFSEVTDVNELFGAYGSAEAEAGAVKSSSAQVLTKGTVQLALAGTGEGWSLGVSGAKFEIKRQ